MKKTILTLIGSCLFLSGQAAPEDVESLDNTLYILPQTVKTGEQTDISVRMKNSVTISDFVCEIVLPEGMRFVPQNNSTDLECQLNAERIPEGMVINVTGISTENNGAQFNSSADQNMVEETGFPYFLESDGEIMRFSVAVDDNMPAGEYTIVIKNMELTNFSTGQRAGDLSRVVLETTVTVAPSFYELDENSTTAPETATDVNVHVKRTIKADNWSTICLPFAMTEAQTKTAFGNDVQLGDFTGYETTEDGDAITGITVNFSEASAIEANHPYIIKVSQAVSEFTVDDVDINPEEKPTKAVVKRTKKQWSEMIGTYVANTPVGDAEEEAWCLFLSDNKFWYSMGQTKMKAFRAYFDFYDVLTSVENAEARVFVVFDGETTGIGNVQRETVSDDRYYNLNGQQVTAPKKGLYIKNGKKVMIK